MKTAGRTLAGPVIRGVVLGLVLAAGGASCGKARELSGTGGGAGNIPMSSIGTGGMAGAAGAGRAPGQLCSTGVQCLNGNCVDGHCCTTIACGTCMTCGNSAGTCAPVTSADDDTCDTDRTCDPNGKCSYKAKALSIGGIHVCAILTNGQVKCWGDNRYGQLGQGDTANRGDGPGEMGGALPPINLGTGRTATAIAAGGAHTCAILDNGALKCWGANFFGQLGLGDANHRGDNMGEMGDALPAVDLGAGHTARQITTGVGHTCALLETNQIRCWGRNNAGQLGQGDTVNRGDNANEMGAYLAGIPMGGVHTVLAVSAGDSFTCAILDDRTVKCWGFNGTGQLGIAAMDNRGDGPGEMSDLLPVVNLGTGALVSTIVTAGTHSCVILTDNQLKCWGIGSSGQLGLGDGNTHGTAASQMGDNLLAVNLGTGRSAKAISAANGTHSCALLDNYQMKCWGSNDSGQLGIGSTLSRGNMANQMGDNLLPLDLGTGNIAVAVSAGGSNSCALLTNGFIKCWGLGGDGELGLGGTDNRGDAAGELGNALPLIDLGP